MAKDVIKREGQYHVGDVFKVSASATYFGFVGNAGNIAGGYIYLPKELGNDITGFSVSGSVNFWGDSNGRITGCTIASVQKTAINELVLSINFPSGTTRAANTIGFINTNIIDITFT